MVRGGFLKRIVHRLGSKSNSMSVQSGDIVDYIGKWPSKNRKRNLKSIVFDPDNNVFHLMVELSLLFMILYVLAVSVPSWYIVHEPVTNFTSCTSADTYIKKEDRAAQTNGMPYVSISSSLWFVVLQVGDSQTTYSRYMPFVSLTKASSFQRGEWINIFST